MSICRLEKDVPGVTQSPTYRVEVNCGRFDIVTSSMPVAVDHILKYSLGARSRSRFSALSQGIDDLGKESMLVSSNRYQKSVCEKPTALYVKVLGFRSISPAKYFASILSSN
jgi:hypothetical protein